MKSTPELVVEAMKGAELRWVVTVPDSATRPLQRIWRSDPFFRVVTACHEGEAVAIGCGLSIAGRRVMVVMENAGLFQCGDALRSIAIDMQVPLVLGVSYQGRVRSNMSADMAVQAAEERVGGPGSHIVQQAQMTEPWLAFWRIPYGIIDGPDGAALIPWALAKALERNGPAAVIIDPAIGEVQR